METKEQIERHNEVARIMDRLDYKRNVVAFGFVIFWLLWLTAVALLVLHYV